MIKVYINYPVPHMTIHRDPTCGNIQAQHKSNQRYIQIKSQVSLDRERNNFRQNKYRFAANPAHNDMWLEIDFHDFNREQEVLQDICRIIGNHYRPLRGVKPKTHSI